MPPTTVPRNRRRAARLTAATALAAAALLGSCTGERPSLGPAAPRSTASSTTTAAPQVSSTTTSPQAAEPGPETLLGFIATPLAEPVVRAEPDDGAPAVDIPAETSAGAPTTFAIVGDGSAPSGGWYQVVLPTRPNGSTAWVPVSSVKVTKTTLRIFVDLSERHLRVEDDGKEVFSTETAIGTEENPTPVGSTYVTELIDNDDPGGAYGPYAYGLALHSDTLSEFAGGNGQVGIHGTNRPELIGQAVSHGCVRLANADVERLVDLELPLGVPVFIT